ncbi:MAG: hypothetical protein HC822_00720 [Oscillochloris sp.]|nr:hypothetical protein [Oscillochloris sp.]
MSTHITVSGYTLALCLDKHYRGTLVRLPDQIEASFNSYESLVHLLEGMLGRRRWQEQGATVLAMCDKLVQGCASNGKPSRCVLR